ncbi:hypothetical protein LSUE1_G009415, partial [Lachnellula suecica]
YLSFDLRLFVLKLYLYIYRCPKLQLFIFDIARIYIIYLYYRYPLRASPKTFPPPSSPLTWPYH